METIIPKRINPDIEYDGFTVKTRKNYQDLKILEDELIRDIYHIPEKPKVVIDVGAHIGGTSLRCAREGATVYAFEPEASNFETLKYNVSKNNFEDKIHIFNKGIGESGTRKLFVHRDNSGAAADRTFQKGLRESVYQMVEFTPLNDFFEEQKIEFCDLLKLDCEGGEEYIIENLTDSVASKIGQVSVEFHEKPKIGRLLDILGQWYDCEHSNRYEWVCRKKV